MPGRVQLVRASTTSLEVCWGTASSADAYLLQIQKYDMPPASGITSLPTEKNSSASSSATSNPSAPVALKSVSPAKLTPVSNPVVPMRGKMQR